ncbi:type I restriction enzyme M protein [Parabacteroides sp. PFB2-12]|uniref:N-6 DNA methylase n=1 Tax=unclassified Parabacteroides TaxID=2649774 RepID=UPI002474F933|nr:MULTISPECIES: N-6 DNA methylase [unclassified Parabacteroides]MDH6343573.1 type I restriction enzyme M protein [Parabacteroides sp. PM6-13]MDH6391446.1 type I restriction enzyme M protein [Parabacteroides sp. PFB2-12]
MLNTHTLSATQSFDLANVLFSAPVETVKTPTRGKVFAEDDFAKNWESIYLHPNQLKSGEVVKGMRKLTSSALVISSHGNSMVFILASMEEPVYIPGAFEKGEQGYFMAFYLAPVLNTEYVYYMCQFGAWRRIVNNIDAYETGLDWSSVGMFAGSDGHGKAMYIDPEDIIRNAGKISLPSISAQEELVEAAKKQAAKIAELSTSQYNVADIVSRYTDFGRVDGLFRTNNIPLLAELYRRCAGGSVNRRVLEVLKLEEFNREVLTESELSFLEQHLAELFTLVVTPHEISLHSTIASLQPKEVIEFLCTLAAFPEDVTVYNPFAGVAAYTVALPNQVVGEEIDEVLWALAQIRLFANSVAKGSCVMLGDSFEKIASDTVYKAIITTPCFSKEKGREVSDIINQLYAKLDEDGKLVCIVPVSFLFSKNRSILTVRKQLIEERAVNTVIKLPSNIFVGTSLEQAAIILTKGKSNEDILFADASDYTRISANDYRTSSFDSELFLKDLEKAVVYFNEQGCAFDESAIGVLVAYTELIGLDLTPSIYLTEKPKDGILLSELAVELPLLRGKEVSSDYFITGASIPEAMHRKPYVPTKQYDGKRVPAKNYVQVAGDAVLIALVNGCIRTAYMENFFDVIAFPSGFVKVLQPQKEVSAKYLSALLSTKLVADQIKAQASGTIIPRLSTIDLSLVSVPRHENIEERERVVTEVLLSEMSDLEDELQEALDKQKREIGSTRHAMIQTLSALSSNWEQLNLFAQKKGGSLSLLDTVGRINPISVKDLMGSIDYAISTLQRQVESLRFEKADWGEEVAINPYEFINTYVATHATPTVRMLNVGNDNQTDYPCWDDETGELSVEHTDAAFVFYAPKRLLERIFNNIVTNAMAHGFSAEKSDNEIKFDWKAEDGNIVITIANNGLPFKSGVSGEDVLMSGFTTALHENAADGTLHSGQGGFEIKALMEGLGSVEVISQPDAEFPVIYKLVFEKTNTLFTL